MNALHFSVMIPARLQSTRLPMKALANIEGKPMVIRVAEQAKKSSANFIYVVTDSEEIERECVKYNVDYIRTNSRHQSGTDRITEAVMKSNIQDDIVVNVQGDEPLINPDLIDQLAQFTANNKTSVATAAHYIHNKEDFENPNCVKVIKDKLNHALYFSRSSIPFNRNNDDELFKKNVILRHIGIYAYKTDFLRNYFKLEPALIEQVESLEQLRVLWNGYKIGLYVTSDIPQAGVDTFEDLERVRTIFKNR